MQTLHGTSVQNKLLQATRQSTRQLNITMWRYRKSKSTGTSDPRIIYSPPGTSGQAKILQELALSGEELMRSLRSRTEIDAYVAKLAKMAHVFTCSENGTPIGMVAAYVDSSLGTAFVTHLGVCPEVRGSGVAAELLECVFDLARDSRCRTVQLDVDRTNERALRFYHRLGFVFEADAAHQSMVHGVLALNTFKWEKLGRVFKPERVDGRSWLAEFAQAPATLIFDDFVRVYFSCRPAAEPSRQYVSYSAYVDLDRADLFKIRRVAENPILSLGGLGEFDEFGTYPVSVIRDGDDVRAYYAGWTRCESVPFNVAIGCAVSSDGGNTFSKMGRGPIIPYSLDEPFILSGPKIRRFNEQWVLWYIAGRKWKPVDGRPEPIYKIRMAFSDDGIQWKKVNKDLIESRVEEDEAQASPDVFESGGKFHMFFCYRYGSHYRGKERGYRIGYASSTNLTDWVRDDARAGIDVSAEGWDSEMVSYPHVFALDGKIYMAYLGNQVGRHGFGLAVLDGSFK